MLGFLAVGMVVHSLWVIAQRKGVVRCEAAVICRCSAPRGLSNNRTKVHARALSTLDHRFPYLHIPEADACEQQKWAHHGRWEPAKAKFNIHRGCWNYRNVPSNCELTRASVAACRCCPL